MESLCRRSSTITTSVTDRSSDDLHFSSLPQSLKGEVQKQRSLKLAADFSCGTNPTEEDLVAFESDQRSSQQISETPMKKLFALEMPKGNESKRRSPSVIGRLMGLDRLPPQQLSCKQQRKSSDTGPHKALKGSPSSSHRSSRKSSQDEQEFKDVFEVLDAAKMESSCYSCENTKPTIAKVALIQQNFKDAKCLSADEKFQDSKELDDALEVLDSNKDLLLQCLPKSDFLFTKYLHDQQSTTHQSYCLKSSTMKASQTLGYGNSCLHKKENETLQMINNTYPRKHQEVVLNQSSGSRTSSPRSSQFPLQQKNDHDVLPTRIVVLKPNLGKSLSPTKIMSPPRSSHHISSDSRKDGEFVGFRYKDGEILNNKRVQEDVGLSRHAVQESREIPKEITRQIRNSFGRGCMKFSNSTLRGYAGDESSCDSSPSESGYDSDILSASSKYICDWNKQLRNSSCDTESFVSREVKKRLSQRWKMTHTSQDVGSTFRSNTLGAILAISDRNEPLGISSRDGWRDGCLSNLSRSRSVPSSLVGFGSHKTSIHHEILSSNKFVMPKEGMKRERNKAVRGNFYHWEDSFSRNIRSRDKKAQPAGSSANKKKSNILPQSCIPYYLKGSFKGDELSEQNLLVSEPSACDAADTSSVPNYTVDVNYQNSTMLSAASDLKSCAPALMHDETCNDNFNASSCQGPADGLSNKAAPDHPASQLESQTNSKEGDQPSPISILEAPFTDDSSSSSECFDSLSANLHGLRMHLELPKLESEPREEGPMLVSSDEDAAEHRSVAFPEKNMSRTEDSWESSYLVDILTDSGIKDADPDTFMATWHSPDCPVNPLVFEELEKRYNHDIYRSRAERKLMFDCINSKLLEIHQECTDQHLLVKSGTRVLPRWKKQVWEDKLQNLLLLLGKDVRMPHDAGDTALASESKWLDLREDIDAIGREVERLLTDELVTEVVAV